MASLKSTVRTNLERVETRLDRVFTPRLNPLYQLGALGWYLFWIVTVSGIYLYVFFDTGVVDAYESVERITHVQWYAGGIMRSLHRYASDALVLVAMLHLLREYVLGRYRGPRWVAWFTGVPILWLVFAAGVSGYWLVWDMLAQYVAISTTEWLDALPFFGEPIARNFIHPSALTGRFFTLMVFIHIAAPLILLFAMWVHIQRLTHPKVNPPLGLAVGTLLALVALSLVRPALSQGPADLARVPSQLEIDWYYLFFLPLQDRISGELVWVMVAVGTLGLALMPWIGPRWRTVAAAKVDLENCNGCARCAADCPCSAVMMQPRSDGRAFSMEARVRPELCLACGICAGACPTSTPFRRRSALVPGIDMPDLPVEALRERTLETAAGLAGEGRVLVYTCTHGPDVEALAGDSVGVVTLPCIGMLPPSFIDLVLSRNHADGVLLTGCRTGDCHHRLGIDWTVDRLDRVRDPYLRQRVARDRVETHFLGVDRKVELAGAVARFRSRLAGAAESTR